MLVKASELRLLDVINVLDGRKLGRICDLDIDFDEGRVKAIIVEGQGRSLLDFGHNDDVEIPWSRVQKIGVDVILVQVKELARDTELDSG